MQDIIRTEALTKYYGRSRGVDGLTFSVCQGDIFGFIGPNGAGKSTTIRILLGLIKKTSGHAAVFGLDPAKDASKILARVGYMPSEAMFYNTMQAGEIIRMSAKMRRKDCSAESRRLCERFGVDVKKRIEDLSLGNRKKVGIVCAMQHEPELLIFDEPTSGLDPMMQKEFFDLISERHHNGATIMLSSHVLSEVQRHCISAAIIRNGAIAAAGSVEEMAENAAKRVTLYDCNAIPDIPYIISPHISDGTATFLYHGPAKVLISALEGIYFTDITISEPDLEETFFHFYKRDDEALITNAKKEEKR